MSENEKELLRMIRESDGPEDALENAVRTILAYLSQPESFEAQAAAYLLGHA